MKHSTRRIMSSLLALFFFMGALIVFFSFIMPLYGQIQEVRAEEASARMKLENQKQIVEQVQKLIASYEQGARVQQMVAEALPLTPNVSEALLQLNGMAQANNLIPRSFSVLSSNTDSTRNTIRSVELIRPVASVNIKVDFSGTYEDFRNFLKNVETNIRLFDVKAISVQPAGRTAQNLFTFSITVAAYYQTK